MIMNESFVISSNGCHIEGYDWIVEDPKCVVCLIHGIGEYAARYDHVASYFQANDIAMMAIDLRGHGKSDGKRGHAAPRLSIFADMDLLIERAFFKYPDKPVYLYGHSMGGNIVLDYRARGALRDLLSGAVVTAPWLTLKRRIKPSLIWTMRILAAVKPDILINTGLQANNISRVETEVMKYKTDPMIHHKISALTAINGVDAAANILSAQLGTGRPLLLMHGTEDRICDISGSRQVRAIEGEACTYVEWEGLYHEIHNEKWNREVLDTIVRWLLK
jgi:acylglycerol lipase